MLNGATVIPFRIFNKQTEKMELHTECSNTFLNGHMFWTHLGTDYNEVELFCNGFWVNGRVYRRSNQLLFRANDRDATGGYGILTKKGREIYPYMDQKILTPHGWKLPSELTAGSLICIYKGDEEGFESEESGLDTVISIGMNITPCDPSEQGPYAHQIYWQKLAMIAFDHKDLTDSEYPDQYCLGNGVIVQADKIE